MIGSGLLQGRHVCIKADGWDTSQTSCANFMAPGELRSCMLVPYSVSLGAIHEDASYGTFAGTLCSHADFAAAGVDERKAATFPNFNQIFID